MPYSSAPHALVRSNSAQCLGPIHVFQYEAVILTIKSGGSILDSSSTRNASILPGSGSLAASCNTRQASLYHLPHMHERASCSASNSSSLYVSGSEANALCTTWVILRELDIALEDPLSGAIVATQSSEDGFQLVRVVDSRFNNPCELGRTLERLGMLWAL